MSAPANLPAVSGARPIAFRTRGRSHGAITRLMSPGDLGQWLKPFVFLDAFDIEPKGGPMFGWHPHSGIATLTVVIDGQIGFAETTGVKGVLDAGGIEWMRAGNGVWHSGSVEGKVRAKGFQLWVALPPGLENGVPESRYLSVDDVPVEGPVRVILGAYGKASGRVSAPPGINYLDVQLKAGERWRYQPPAGHDVAWMAVHQGTLLAPDTIDAGELIVFVEGTDAIELEAVDDTRFVLGSAVKHPHDLVLGNYSVHTSTEALVEGEAEIERIGSRFFAS